MIFLFLALLLGLVIAGVAAINNEVVTLNYYFGQIDLTLFMLILGSAAAGAIFMGSLGIYRSIHNYMGSQGERGHKKDLQHRVKVLEDEKKKMEDELKKHQKERDDNAAKAQTALEDQKRNMEDELKKQQKERDDNAAKTHTELEDEKRRLEDELRKQQKENQDAAEKARSY
jgi:uncharacterized integral membrane protein